MYKIGEFSKLTKISVRMLHYYDKKNILKPALIDTKSGYRYYDIKQFHTLQRIIMLRDFNFSLHEISDIIENWSDEYLRIKLNNKIIEKKESIIKQQKQIEDLKYAINNINQDRTSIQCSVIIKSIPTQQVISLRQIIDNYQSEYQIWDKLYNYVTNNKLEIIESNPNNMAIYHDNEHKESDVDIEACFIVKKKISVLPPFVYKSLPAINQVASMIVHGNYENIGNAYQSFMIWLDSHPNYRIDGLSRQITHRDCTNESNPENYITEIQIPLSKI